MDGIHDYIDCAVEEKTGHILDEVSVYAQEVSRLSRLAKKAMASVENHNAYFNNRLLEVESHLKGLNPKFLEVGGQISQAQRDMIELWIERHLAVSRAILNLEDRIKKLEEKCI